MRNLPLHATALKAERSADSNAGLWYERFFDKFIDGYKKPETAKEKDVWSKGKMDWIQSNACKVGDKKILSSFINRQNNLIAAQNGIALVMATDWHFVTGMGNNHPVENGFAWHSTLGVPFLTGAAVKGMLKAWCKEWFDMPKKTIEQWFGTKDRMGEIYFFAAIPIEPVQLKADIMTPHYGDWYAKGDEDSKLDGSNIPADWHDPVPIPFLTVDKGASFQFSISKAPASNLDLNEVSQALSDALQWIGAGAKTAVGYGRFSEDMPAKLQREKTIKLQEQEAKRATMTPLQAELDRWVLSNPEPRSVNQWLDKIEDKIPDEQLQIVESVKAYYESRGTWQKPSKKQKFNVQKIKSILQALS